MNEFPGKVAVITGAASGIGRAIATQAAREGMRLVLADIEATPLERTAADLRATGAEVVDRPDRCQPRRGGRRARRTRQSPPIGAVHLLFNNAGVATGGPIWERPLAEWEWVMGVNLWGVVHGVRSFVPLDAGAGGRRLHRQYGVHRRAGYRTRARHLHDHQTRRRRPLRRCSRRSWRNGTRTSPFPCSARRGCRPASSKRAGIAPSRSRMPRPAVIRQVARQSASSSTPECRRSRSPMKSSRRSGTSDSTSSPTRRRKIGSAAAWRISSIPRPQPRRRGARPCAPTIPDCALTERNYSDNAFRVGFAPPVRTSCLIAASCLSTCAVRATSVMRRSRSASAEPV